jgi:hypothetical protein
MAIAIFLWFISHQLAVLFSQNKSSHQQPGTRTFLSKQTSTSHQPPAKRMGWMRLLDILVDLKSAKPYGRSLSRASARLPVIGRQTLSTLGSAPCLQRHYIREKAPLGDLSQSIYRVSLSTD